MRKLNGLCITGSVYFVLTLICRILIRELSCQLQELFSFGVIALKQLKFNYTADQMAQALIAAHRGMLIATTTKQFKVPRAFCTNLKSNHLKFGPQQI